MERLKLAVAGCGLIGRKHVGLIAAADACDLVAVADPDAAARAACAGDGVCQFDTIEDLLGGVACDGVIIATPNQSHSADAIAAIEAGVPALVEKPIADTARNAQAIVAAAEACGIPILVGHHRRHAPAIARAQALIANGRLGRVVAAHGSFWCPKPDAYFDVAWRRAPGAGPILINLIHDIDLLRALVGEVVRVQAVGANAVRGFEVADTAAVILQFANGALGTFTISDAVVGPWSWEMTAGENPAYPATTESCYWIGGTKGSLALPDFTLWSQKGAPDWWAPIHAAREVAPPGDPLVAQLRNFCDVIRGVGEPVVTAREGAQSLAVLSAIEASVANAGASIDVEAYTSTG
ncbi:MAG: Gfo/Idh/MocA family oxidoreductase [Pseudomonadota bacterium]